MTATASSYDWFREYRRGYLHDGYCLTLVSGLSPEEFLKRISAEPQGTFAGFDAFSEQESEFNDDQEVYGDFMFIGATTAQGNGGDWTWLWRSTAPSVHTTSS